MKLMRRVFIATFSCLIAISAVCQTQESKWTVGTVTAVKPHPSAAGSANTNSFDISVKVGDTVYVVFYTQEPGTTLVQYREGVDVPVLVEENALKVTDPQGVTREVPIVSRQPAPAKSPQ